MTYDTLFADPRGRTSRGAFIGALIVLLAVAAFYHFVVTGRTAQFCLVVLIVPGAILHARRLHDMGRTAWLLVLPVALLAANAWLHLYGAESALAAPVMWASLAVTAAFALWGALGRSQEGGNRFGNPVPA